MKLARNMKQVLKKREKANCLLSLKKNVAIQAGFPQKKPKFILLQLKSLKKE